MNVLKGVALALFSLLLVLSLSVFSAAFTLKSTALNASFMNKQFGNLNVSAIVLEAIDEQSIEELPESVRQQLEQVLPQLESELEEAASELIGDVLAYLNRKASSLDLKLALKESFLNVDSVTGITDRMDLPSLVEDFINDEFLSGLPVEVTAVIDPAQLAADIAADLEQWLEDQIETAVPPVLDYILGDRQTLNVIIPLSPIKESVRENLWQVILALDEDRQQDASWDYLRQNPPSDFKDIVRPDFLSQHPEYSGLSELQLDTLLEDYILNLSRQQADPYLDIYWMGLSAAELRADYDRYFDEYVGFFPASAEIDEETIGTEVVTDLNNALADASDGLAEARKYIGWFIAAYWAILGLILLCIAAIILITNNFKKSSRGLGITFLVFGAVELITALVTANLLPDVITASADMPASLKSYIPQLFSDALWPVQLFGLVLASIGIASIMASVFYKQQQAEKGG